MCRICERTFTRNIIVIDVARPRIKPITVLEAHVLLLTLLSKMKRKLSRNLNGSVSNFILVSYYKKNHFMYDIDHGMLIIVNLTNLQKFVDLYINYSI